MANIADEIIQKYHNSLPTPSDLDLFEFEVDAFIAFDGEAFGMIWEDDETVHFLKEGNGEFEKVYPEECKLVYRRE